MPGCPTTLAGQGPAVLVAGAGRVECFLILFFPSRISYLPFLMPHLLGNGYCGLGRCNPAVFVSYYRRGTH